MSLQARDCGKKTGIRGAPGRAPDWPDMEETAGVPLNLFYLRSQFLCYNPGAACLERGTGNKKVRYSHNSLGVS